MPARVAEGSFPGQVPFRTLVFHLPSFFMTYAETGLMYENTAWSAMGEKTKVMRVPVDPLPVSDKSCRDSPANSTIVNLQSKLGRT